MDTDGYNSAGAEVDSSGFVGGVAEPDAKGDLGSDGPQGEETSELRANDLAVGQSESSEGVGQDETSSTDEVAETGGTETVEEVSTEDYYEDIIQHLDYVITADFVLVIITFALLGAICTQTFTRSLEVRK